MDKKKTFKYRVKYLLPLPLKVNGRLVMGLEFKEFDTNEAAKAFIKALEAHPEAEPIPGEEEDYAIEVVAD